MPCDDIYEDDTPIHGFGFIVKPCRFFGFQPITPEIIEVGGVRYYREDTLEMDDEDFDETEPE